MDDTDKLARLMQSLPQEIFEDIYRRTFELPRFTGLKGAHEIPFTFLHVDYSSREEVATRFYSTASIIHYRGTPATYLNFIPRHHRYLIPEVFCAWNFFNCTKYEIEHRSMNPAFMPHGTIVRWYCCKPILKSYYTDPKACNLVMEKENAELRERKRLAALSDWQSDSD